ncbi:class I SAM-dependent methyltransferase [Corynebacterium sp. 335C]
MADFRTWTQITAADPGHSRRYAQRWEAFRREGRDIDGEARLIDAMAPRGARILDAGCGQGRVGGYLADRGHHVVGVDVDAHLIRVAAAHHPGATWLEGDLADLGAVLAAAGEAGPFDLQVCAGNVLGFVDPADRGAVLRGLRDALADDGRLVAGFGAGRGWGFDEFAADAGSAGLRVSQRFATWGLRPFDPAGGFLVAVLERG